MTRPDLDAIEARANAATPGPWCSSSEYGYWQIGPTSGDGCERLLDIDVGNSDNAHHDAPFVAEARTDIPALLAYARELEARVAGLENVLVEEHEAHAAWKRGKPISPEYVRRAAARSARRKLAADLAARKAGR